MSETSVQKHLSELALSNAEYYEVVQRVRSVVMEVAPEAVESVMYGGIMFAAPVQFCGVFAYTGHVSLEFGRGFELADECSVLEGSGKLRRHVKLGTVDEVETKHVRDYVTQAFELMMPA